MRSCWIALVATAAICLANSDVVAQTVVVMRPPARVVHSPVIPAYGPVVVHSSPVVTTYSHVITAPPVVTYHPVIPARAVVRYRPAITVYSVPGVIARGRQVIVRPKVYVRGQPVRNILRAITP